MRHSAGAAPSEPSGLAAAAIFAPPGASQAPRPLAAAHEPSGLAAASAFAAPGASQAPHSLAAAHEPSGLAVAAAFAAPGAGQAPHSLATAAAGSAHEANAGAADRGGSTAPRSAPSKARAGRAVERALRSDPATPGPNGPPAIRGGERGREARPGAPAPEAGTVPGAEERRPALRALARAASLAARDAGLRPERPPRDRRADPSAPSDGTSPRPASLAPSAGVAAPASPAPRAEAIESAAAPRPPDPPDTVSGAVLASAANLKLETGDASALSLHLRIRGDVAHLRIEGEAGAAIHARDSELSRALAAEGLSLGRLEVEARPSPASAAGTAGPGRREADHAPGQQRRDPHDAQETPAPTAHPPRRNRRAGRPGLDVEA